MLTKDLEVTFTLSLPIGYKLLHVLVGLKIESRVFLPDDRLDNMNKTSSTTIFVSVVYLYERVLNSTG